MHWFMKNPEKAASGSGCGDDHSHGPLAFGLQFSAGRLSGTSVRIPASFAQPAPAAFGCGVFPGCGMGLDLYLLCRLPGRHPYRLPAGHGHRYSALAQHLRPLAAACIFRILVPFGAAFPAFSGSLEKNFGNYKNFVCICGKMGYNKVYENVQIPKNAEKGIPWQKKPPRPRM